MGYVDSSYTGDFKDRKSITGYSFFLKRAIITWCNKWQLIVLTSISEAEFVTMSQKVKEEV